jgi:hypothetical protein
MHMPVRAIAAITMALASAACVLEQLTRERPPAAVAD